MEKITLSCTTKLVKSILAFSIALFGIFVALGNILDYQSNWQFVQHILSMDSMKSWFHADALRQERRITSLIWQQRAYWLIIFGEGVFGSLCLAGAAFMFWGIRTVKNNFFIRGKIFFTLGCCVAILVWYTGFAVIGGEYFLMWANQWDSQMKAYTFIGFIVLSLMFILQPEST